jgi:hypothetical protein
MISIGSQDTLTMLAVRVVKSDLFTISERPPLSSMHCRQNVYHSIGADKNAVLSPVDFPCVINELIKPPALNPDDGVDKFYLIIPGLICFLVHPEEVGDHDGQIRLCRQVQ